ncbi:unnamed protein product, partial [Rotaria sp. Silwood1]
DLLNCIDYIIVNDDRQQFVCCNACKGLLLHSSLNGTNNLCTHVKSCPKKEKSSFAYQKTVHDFYSCLKLSPIPRKIKFSATEACTEFCALDARAFDVVKGDGFKNLAKTLFGVGRGISTSSIEITDLLPHPTTISTNITRLYEEYKIQLIDICEQLTSFCLIVDQWTEAHTGIRYCGIALRYVEEYSQLFTFIIGCFRDNAASHSAQHLREFVNKILEEYKLQLDSTKFVVTDNEPKMLPAFREQCSRVGSADHYLNKQLQHAFQSDQIHLNKNTTEKVDCELVQNIFNQVKKVVSSKKQQLFPILSKIAKVICAVPAANTIIERPFSAAKNNMQTLKQLSNNDFRRKRTVSMSSTTTVSSEESTCTVAKKSRIDVEDNLREYNSTLKLGRISIRNTFCTITPFLAGDRMTYCTRCWRLGHMRDKCDLVHPRCRICLNNLIDGQTHDCSNVVRCAQCDGHHHSLSNECEKVAEYRFKLKEQVNNAISTGKLHRLVPQDRAQPIRF